MPLLFAPASSARDLREKLKGSLARSKVWDVKPHIAINDPHKRNIGEIVSLRDHLGAD
jgi:hypothetical protein